MAGDPFEPDPETVLEALADPACRAILEALDEPRTASEVAEAADVPQSTTYRKLELLSEAALLDEGMRIRTDGSHATEYEVGFEVVRVAMEAEPERTVAVAVEPRGRSPSERLSHLWTEVSKET